MPNGKTHAIIGTAAGVAGSLYPLHEGLSGWELAALGAGGAAGGWLGAKLPDIFEPATSPNHRKFAHSLVFNGSVVVGVIAGAEKLSDQFQVWISNIKRKIDGSQDQNERFLWSVVLFAALFFGGFTAGLASGYLSHVALDAFTPASIPVIGVQ